MTLPHSQVARSDCQEPEDGAKARELDQRRLDDRKALEAAVSEGWPVPRSRPRSNARPDRPYRTGSQTWGRRRTTRVQP